MNDETRRNLNRLNRAFYEDVAVEFDRTREHPWPGWRRVLDRVRETHARTDPLRVLDLGCGNGRFGDFLAKNWGTAIRYDGVDANSALLRMADERLQGRACLEASTLRIDLLDGPADEMLPKGPFDLVVAFGLFHHLPGAATRRAVLTAMGERLAAHGVLALTAWRFGDSPRFTTRMLDWESHNREADRAIDLEQLEVGDHLLLFGQQSPRPRYCHHTSDSEFESWSRTPGLREVDRFEADGRSEDLNRYLLLARH